MWKIHKDKIENDILILSEIQIQTNLDEKYRQGIQDLAQKIISHYNDCEGVMREKTNEVISQQAIKEAEKEIVKEMEGKHTTQ